MIILSCRYCGSCNLKPNGYKFEAVCECGRELHLWEMQLVYSAERLYEPKANVSERTGQKLTQSGV